MTKLSAVILFMVSLSVTAALAAEPPVFKNTDLEKYSPGGQPKENEQPRAAGNEIQQPRETDAGSVDSPQYWCAVATEADNRVRRAEENLSQAKLRRAEAWRHLSSGVYSAAVETDARAQKEQENAEAELAEAKQEKARLENEAHQKNIPAGWLRCQFE